MSEEIEEVERKCSICWKLSSGEEMEYRRSYNALHANCNTCSITPETISTYLCSICNHLRVPHSVGCLENMFALFSLGYWETLSELLSRSPHCHLCRAVAKGIIAVPDEAFYGGRKTDDSNAHTIRVSISSTGILATSPQMHGSVSFALWRFSTKSEDFQVIGHFSKDRDIRRKTVPTLDTLINWDDVSTWANSIAETTQISPFHIPTRMKVVDVVHNRVIDAPPYCRYIALSYVFGDTKLNAVSSLGLLDRHRLPATIQDALIACQKMGFRFVWIDQLSIDQTDEHELIEQIGQMHDIYRNATCTIVALSGESSLYGLPGVSKGRKWDHNTLPLYDDIIIESLPPLDLLMDHSKWKTRGWTLQEELFSQSLLFFTESGLVYMDRRSESPRFVAENLWYHHYSVTSLAPDSYWFLLERYTRRALSFASDKIRAFTSILNERYGQDGHYYGIPLQEIHRGIVWIPNYLSHAPTRLESMFPSWSWASHTGDIHHISNAAPLAIWAKPELNASTQTLKICKPAMNSKWEKYNFQNQNVMASICAAWMARCIRSPLPDDIAICTPTISRLMERWPTYDEFWKEAFAQDLHDSPFAHLELGFSPSFDRVLAVYCEVAYFDLHPPPQVDPNTATLKQTLGKRTFRIRSSGGNLLGAIWIPAYHEVPPGSWNGEFLLLSVSSWPGNILIDASDVEGDSRHRDDVVYFYQDECQTRATYGSEDQGKFNGVIVVDVMLIERAQDDGIARRIGVGQMFLKRWCESERHMKTVIIE